MLERVLAESPAAKTILRTRVHRDLGLHALKNEKLTEALKSFQTMAQEAPNSTWRAYALTLQGKTSFEKNETNNAAKLFLEATKIIPPAIQQETLLNAGLSLLKADDLKKLDPLLEIQNVRATLLLERGLNLTSKKNPAARKSLELFLAETQDHPREKEARLALAESAALTDPKDTALSIDQLKQLKFNDKTEIDFAAKHLLISLSLDEESETVTAFLEKSAELTISFLAKNPKHNQNSRIRFELARYQMRTNQDGEAWGNLEALIESDPDNPLSDTARLLSARSAITTSNKNNYERAFTRYSELIKGGGPLAIDATIEKASALIDLEEGGKEALKTLTPLLKQKKLAPQDRRRVLVAAATAAKKEQDYAGALGYYKQLLLLPQLPISWRNRVYYESGRILENLNQPAQALDAYIEVINAQLDPEQLTESEWEWFDKCGLSAMTLLENDQKWRAAISIAEKIARSGDRDEARAAAARAKRLRLDHRIYEN